MIHTKRNLRYRKVRLTERQKALWEDLPPAAKELALILHIRILVRAQVHPPVIREALLSAKMIAETHYIDNGVKYVVTALTRLGDKLVDAFMYETERDLLKWDAKKD